MLFLYFFCPWYLLNSFFKMHLSPPRTNSIITLKKHFPGVSLFTGYCYAINIIMGSGFLVIPAGMASLGMIGGTSVLLFAASVMGITVGYEVDCSTPPS